MARIVLASDTGELERPLATASVVGRHPGCTWRIDEARLPLFWVELRWVGSWAWRVLAGAEDTRGPGRSMPGGWRRLRQGDRIRGPGSASLMLAEGSAPTPFLLDVESGQIGHGDAVEDHVEWRADGAWPVSAESDLHRRRPLEDGEVFRSGARILRFHSGDPPRATVRGAASLASPDVEIEVALDDGQWTLTVMDGPRSVDLTAEYVRVLVPYLEVRRIDLPPGGWLELDAAHFRWQQLGGSSGSQRERIAQDRSRLTRALGRRGVTGASELFETRRGPEGWVTRVRLEPGRLHLDR